MFESINMYWEGVFIESVQECIDSFVAQGHKVNMWCYSNNPYSNCQSCDANDIITWDNLYGLFHGKAGLHNVIERSDWFRINLIYQLGGWYSDTDCYCISPLDFAEKNIVVNEGVEGINLNNNLFRFEKGSHILKDYLENFDFTRSDWGYVQFGEIVLKYSNELNIVSNNILNVKVDESPIHQDVKAFHLVFSIDSIKNMILINKIKAKINGCS